MADLIKNFPEDLLIRILVNLPVKLRSVSKYFCELIKNPEFIRIHLNKKKDHSLLYKTSIPYENSCIVRRSIYENSIDHRQFSFPNFNFFGYEFVGSDLNGLVCIASWSGHETYLCNPALMEFRPIPPCPFGFEEGYSVFSDCTSGFGFDPKSKGYKFVHLVTFRSDYTEEFGEDSYEDAASASYIKRVELYDLKNDSWREIDGFEFPLRTGGGRCYWHLSFNGVCHWVSFKDYSGNSDDVGRIFILCFDLSAEAFGSIEFPDEIAVPKNRSPALFALHGCVSVVHFVDLSLDEFIDIWVMKEYGVQESWIKQYVIGPVPIECPLSFLDDSRLLLESRDGQMVICTLETNEIQRLDVFGVPTTLRVVPYRESLVSVASFFKGLEN